MRIIAVQFVLSLSKEGLSIIEENFAMKKSSRNRTITVEDTERADLKAHIIHGITHDAGFDTIQNRIIAGDIFEIVPYLPARFADLLIVDPPYNLNKNFGSVRFKKESIEEYSRYIERFFTAVMHTLKTTASIYICGDWYTSTSLHLIASKYFEVQNRITWQREKGRGAQSNWKNAHEDIWFCTVSKEYIFNVNNVKMRKKVIAPYKENGKPKDWQETEQGNFRDTYPSNFWDDITIPYWSMSENTEHPTQKPEKLIAKLILASSNEGDCIFDPFAGSGTSCVVAKKLKRAYIGIEIDQEYACVSQKRLNNICNNSIQGYTDGVFWERNTLHYQKKKASGGLLW